METKKIMGTALVAFGLVGLVPGMLGLLKDKRYLESTHGR